MKGTKRYLVALPGKPAESAAQDLKLLLSEEKEASVVRALPSGHQVVEMTEEQANALAARNPGIVIEEDQDLELFMPMPGLTPRVDAASERIVEFKVTGGNSRKPLANATVYGVGANYTTKAVTDAEGKASLKLYGDDLVRIIVSPDANFWSRVLPPSALADGKTAVVKLEPLEPPGRASWTRKLLGAEGGNGRFSGRGVKVAVIDSGIAEHADLKVDGGFNTIDGGDPAAFRVDEKGHGTHCAGIIGGQGEESGVAGIAPGAELYSLKVFPGGKISDLIEAIRWSIENKMDVLSMSLGIRSPSELLGSAIAEALESGLTCVAASGNDSSGTVSWPAAYDGVVAVSALGNMKEFPQDSGHSLRISDLRNEQSGLFFASFSNYGPPIALCAPGVAIISSVPTGYAAWDGTSMACPFVTAVAALILEAYPSLRTGDYRQPLMVREVLASTATDLDLPAELQGTGVPNVAAALAQARTESDTSTRVARQRDMQVKKLSALLATVNRRKEEIEKVLAQIGES